MTSLDVSPAVGPQGGTSRLGFTGVQLTVRPEDLRRIETMFAFAPTIVAKHMRDVFGQFAGSHRRAVLQGATPNYQRLLRKSLFYRVRPKQVAQSSGGAVGGLVRSVARLQDIRMRIWATSAVTLLHETGGTVTSKGKRMAIPVGGTEGNVRGRRVRGAARKRESTPAAMKAAGVNFVRKGDLLFRVDKTAKGRDRLKLTHLLTGAVHIKPSLKIIGTWNLLRADRQRRMDKAISAAAAEMARVGARKVGAALSGVLRAVS